MRNGEKGFNTIELIISIALITIIGLGSYMVTHQTMTINSKGQSKMTVVTQAENAGYWIILDAQMAENITTDDLTSPNFIIISWTDWDVLGLNSVYHTSTYYFDDLADGIGILMRRHWSSAGANETSIVGEYIYYEPTDPGNTSSATYQSPELTVRIVTEYKGTIEKREYKITQRPNYDW
ncbi:MAG: hypothetical protein JW856_01355 [Dehalococcoidales bacterium]|nr:hypothetical protein [Dehalococcoidales bacterium]